MNPAHRKCPQPLAGFWSWLFGKVPQVPPDIAACEFDCRELECSQGQWERCEHRLEWADKLRRNPAGAPEARDEIPRPLSPSERTEACGFPSVVGAAPGARGVRSI